MVKITKYSIEIFFIVLLFTFILFYIYSIPELIDKTWENKKQENSAVNSMIAHWL